MHMHKVNADSLYRVMNLVDRPLTLLYQAFW